MRLFMTVAVLALSLLGVISRAGTSSSSSSSSFSFSWLYDRDRYWESDSVECECDNDCDCNRVCINNCCVCPENEVEINNICVRLPRIGEPCRHLYNCTGDHVVCDPATWKCLCADGYFLTQEAVCVNCSDYNEVSHATPCPGVGIENCTRCEVGFVLKNGQCVVPLCSSCNSSDDCDGPDMTCTNNVCICTNDTYPNECGGCSPKLPEDSVCESDAQCQSDNCICDECKPVGSDDCCSDCGQMIADIVFIIDNSGSVGYYDYRTVRAFAIAFMNQFKVSENDTQFGLVDFSTKINMIYGLNSDYFNDNMKVAKALCSLRYRGGYTRTDMAVRETIKIFLSPQKRPSIRNYAILVTDGGANDDGEKFIADAARDLKNMNATEVYVIAVGPYVNRTELELIATGPSYIFDATSYKTLDFVTVSILKDLCAHGQSA